MTVQIKINTKPSQNQCFLSPHFKKLSLASDFFVNIVAGYFSTTCMSSRPSGFAKGCSTNTLFLSLPAGPPQHPQPRARPRRHRGPAQRKRDRLLAARHQATLAVARNQTAGLAVVPSSLLSGLGSTLCVYSLCTVSLRLL